MKYNKITGLANLPGNKVCLLSHYAAVNTGFRSTLEVLHESGCLHSVLGPQHGYWGETQDNMIEWEGYIHPRYHVPVFSLYGKTREPSEQMLHGADCVLIDLCDVGSRYYTYIYTMALTMRKCHELGIPVAVADRPNPIGNTRVEGPLLNTEFSSFVGMYPIPVRHGLSIGELAVFFADFDGISRPVILKSEEVPRWVMPSPNMPSRETALVYPGMCLLEATNLSEGRGTTRPFEIFGAPWIDPWAICNELNGSVFMQGAVLRPHYFIPTFNKHQGTKCGGAQIHVTDQESFRPFLCGLGILEYCLRSPESCWNPPPYEYEYRRMPIDILAGGTHVREMVDAGSTQELVALSFTPEDRWNLSDRFIFR